MSTWFYVGWILIPAQIADEAAHHRPRGNLSDLYPRWLGARELLLHGRNPYSNEITIEIQKGYYGRALDPSLPEDSKDQQAFAYPVYVSFLLAPAVTLPFETVQACFRWLLAGVSVAAVWFWLRALHWQLPFADRLICAALLLGSFPAVQGIKLQQLSLLVAAMLAGAAACVTAGYLVLAGTLLALATIKPQLAWPLVLALLLWSAAEWRTRWRLAAGFAVTMAILLAASEFVLPGWLKMFWQALANYLQYTDNHSVLEQFLSWALDPWVGKVFSLFAIAACGALLWSFRAEHADSESLGVGMALVMALTVLIVPKNSLYNHVLLLPAILVLAREIGALNSGSRSLRFVYALGVFALAWPWLANLGLCAVWFFSHATAMDARQLPLYTIFSLPLIVFILMFASVRRSRLLAARDATR